MEPSEQTGEEPENTRLGQGVRQLWSYQCGLRLRHLTQLVGRNLQGHPPDAAPTPACPLPSCHPRPNPTVGYYFSLHTPRNNAELYRSEVQSSVNPNWQELQPDTLTPINLRSLKGVLVRLWLREPGAGEGREVCRWGVCWSGLVPVGEVPPSAHHRWAPNTLVFRLRHLYYTAPDARPDHPAPTLRLGFSLPLSETKRSYSVTALSRLHCTKRAQRQQEVRCQETCEILEMKGVTRTSRNQVLAAQVEDCRVRVMLLREQLEAEIDQLRAIKLSADNLDNQNQEKGLELLGGYQDLHRQLAHWRGLREGDAAHTQRLTDNSAFLSNWRRQLITQLPLIYPITQEEGGKYQICGVHLPDAESYEGQTEVGLSVALGFVVHLVTLLARLLHLPLRYPMRPLGSQATITDTTSPQLRDNERQFPLYTRGKERERLHFYYGVFLLNKNIAQMRWYCGLPTPDLRLTLPNLHFLITKLIQPGTVGSQVAAIMPDVQLPTPPCQSPVSLEVRTPATLLAHRRSPRLPLNPVGRPSTSLDEMDGQPGKGAGGSEETTSSEPSPVKTCLYVREAAPLASTDKFVFVDKVKGDKGPTSAPLTLDHPDLDERLAHTNVLSFSLDNGLDHLGGKMEPYYKIKDLSSCDDLKLMNNVSKALSHSRGSDPSLLASAAEVEEDGLPVFKEQTTELLKSWHENEPSHYAGTLGSSEKLEEVGVECDESFMQAEERSGGREAVQGGRTPDTSTNNDNTVSEASTGQQKAKEDAVASQPERKGSDVEVMSEVARRGSGDTREEDSVPQSVEKVPESSSNAKDSLFQLELGITEDMFLNDVAFRTAALAKQNCSFKMSFSRQSTEDEYH